jgi:NAD+ kinase
MRVGIVAQRDNPRAAELAVSITERLRDEDVTVVVDEATAGSDTVADVDLTSVAIDRMADTDLVVSIGGDGTFLYAARGAGTTPIMGVNLGEVGFLNAVSPTEAVETVSAEVATIREQGIASTRRMNRLQASTEGPSIAPAINEIAVLGPQRGHGNGLDLSVRVDGSLYTSGHADGVLVVTPTGSTAYNLSEGGPLVHPSVSGFIVTEMAGESSMPPLVVDVDSTITVQIEDAPRAVVVSDGRLGERVSTPTEIELSRAQEPVHVAGPALDFFAGLGKLD